MKSEEKHEAENVIQAFRALSEDEQRLAYAVLEGMKIQKALASADTAEPQKAV
ncbi:MAG: hypothetical protein LUG55_08325 [Clostridiales bacterium]|nr:hypothetical protein [Clostridiales bacterium]